MFEIQKYIMDLLRVCKKTPISGLQSQQNLLIPPWRDSVFLLFRAPWPFLIKHRVFFQALI